MMKYAVAICMSTLVWAACAAPPLAAADSGPADPNDSAATEPGQPDLNGVAPTPRLGKRLRPGDDDSVSSPISRPIAYLFVNPTQLLFVPPIDFSAADSGSEFSDLVPPFAGGAQPTSKVGSDPTTGTGNGRNISVDEG
jgi:hypothetical protein